MKAKLKAKELIEKFIEPTKVPNIKHIWVEDIDAAKQCALIAVDEIIKQLTPIEEAPNNKDAFNCWEEVKKEISSYGNNS